MTNKDNWTGERLEPCITGETMLEHLHRYAFALLPATGKQVLDIACGEGYGAALLATRAARVTGIDIAPEVIEKAAGKYRLPNLRFITGSLTAIPADTAGFDLITCFETIEHISAAEQEMAFSELKRVLKPEGLLIMSSPDKKNYSDKTGYQNPFHQKELYAGEFRELVRRYFPFAAFYLQGSYSGSFIMKEEGGPLKELHTGNFEKISTGVVPEPMYHIAVASGREINLPAPGIFLNPDSITRLLTEQERRLKKTITYRTGHALLAPFKFIRSLFRK